MGVKKSTVCTSAKPSFNRYTPASSWVSKPTSTFGSTCRGKPRKTESRIPGLSLAAQPAALAIAVSFTDLVKGHLAFRSLIIASWNGSLLTSSGACLQAGARKCFYHTMPWDFVLIFFVLLVVLPWRGQRRLRRLLELAEVTSKERIALYASTIVFQWTAVALVAWRGYARGLTNAELGLGRQSAVHLALASLIGSLVLAALHWINLKRAGKAGEQRLGKLRAISERILPQSKRELAPYLGLALTAGICEEFLYRGFTMGALFRVGLPVWVVVLLSSVLFGAAHLYQGRSGFLGTLVLGAVFGIARIAYDSIVPVMFWHAAVDVVAGVAGPRYLLQKCGGGQRNAAV